MILMKNTTLILQALRIAMMSVNTTFPPQTERELAAYIIPSSDAHHNIRISECDLRKTYTSGFDGSAGTLIVTPNEALLWTDARYYTQAEMQLDDNWTLMKESLPDTPTQSQWLKRNLGAGQLVGVDPTLYSDYEWNTMAKELNENGIELVAVENNLVDKIWEDRPTCIRNLILFLGYQFSGKSISDKLAEIRSELTLNGADMLVVSELDEVAWLLNLRGSDLPLAPTFFSFLILTDSKVELFLDHHLTDGIHFEISDASGGNFSHFEYDSIGSAIDNYVKTSTGRIWISKNCNYALSRLIPQNRKIIKLTPIAVRKAIKNEIEVAGMRNALIRDGAALCQFYSWLETEMTNTSIHNITEVYAAEKLLSFRSYKNNFISLSFKTISGSGSNGAIIHYFPTAETDRPLSVDEVYLIDAGAHYLDGTTDITRTFHFGNPTDHQRDCYTRVLKGQIAIATAIFPNKTPGSQLDSFARRSLWENGLDYGHGTGHGIGSYLNVGEGPHSINSKYNPDDPGLQENMFTSNEPGYYEEGKFGIRLENIVRIKSAQGTNHIRIQGFLGIEDLTFVPYQQKMIKVDLLTTNEITYLNNYMEKCREITGKYILDNDLGDDVHEWLLKETRSL